MARYTVVLTPEPEVGGYSALVPALPGCVSQGESEAEALDHIREAISLYLGSLQRDGDPIPGDVQIGIHTVEAEPVVPGPVDAEWYAETDPRRAAPAN